MEEGPNVKSRILTCYLSSSQRKDICSNIDGKLEEAYSLFVHIDKWISKIQSADRSDGPADIRNSGHQSLHITSRILALGSQESIPIPLYDGPTPYRYNSQIPFDNRTSGEVLENHNLKLDATVMDFPCAISRDGSHFFF